MARRSILWAAVLSVAVIGVASPRPANAANLFANVSQSGTLIDGNEVSSVTYLGTGQYEVTFTSDVSECAYLATTVHAYSQALQVFTAGGHLTPNGVYVETKNQGGGLTDGPFHLVVVCGTLTMKFAVVGYAGEFVRGTPGTTVINLGGGRYSVVFLDSVRPCAYIATVGDPGNALVFSPSGVYTGSRNNPRAVYIETKNPGGGLQGGIPFHLGVICPAAPQAHTVVVNNTGLPARGSVLTSSFRASTGEYVVVTNVNVSPGCATVATRGSVDVAVPYTPATVELVPGPAANTIGVEVRHLLFFGGDLLDEAFHAAVVCR